MDKKVFVHVVTYNSSRWIKLCVNSVLAQEGFVLGDDLFLSITDNCSSDATLEQLEEFKSQAGVIIQANSINIGFCGAHNQGAKAFLESSCDFLLILNPDIKLDARAVITLRDALITDSQAGSATSKLFRGDDELNVSTPVRLDAAGMELTSSLRHFDRGSERPDTFLDKEYVFGGTGACVMYTRVAVQALLLEGQLHDGLKLAVHPSLAYRPETRVPLFDEAFFAYREDADLAWRAQLLGFRSLFVPDSTGCHRRVVLPDNRSALPPELNGYSVRNRFFLQLNNYFFNNSLASLVQGILFRNLLVVMGVLIKERSSIRFLLQVWKLRKRAMERRALLRSRASRFWRPIV